MQINSGACIYEFQLDNDAYSIGPFRSLINHSCVPNVAYVHIDNKIVTVVIYPVKAGEQLLNVYYDSMGLSHDLDHKATWKLYDFVCDCELCIKGRLDMLSVTTGCPLNYMNRKQLQIAKQQLNAGWQMINTHANPEYRCRNYFDNVLILKCIAYYATAPC
jgi:hypothetical protein